MKEGLKYTGEPLRKLWETEVNSQQGGLQVLQTHQRVSKVTARPAILTVLHKVHTRGNVT